MADGTRWTIEALKEYFDKQIDGVCRKFGTEINSIEKSIGKSEERLDIRLMAMNEWRAQMKDQTISFVTRAETDIQIGNICKRLDDIGKAIRDLEIDRAKLEGKADQKTVMYTAIATAIGLIVSVISLLLRFAG